LFYLGQEIFAQGLSKVSLSLRIVFVSSRTQAGRQVVDIGRRQAGSTCSTAGR